MTVRPRKRRPHGQSVKAAIKKAREEAWEKLRADALAKGKTVTKRTVLCFGDEEFELTYGDGK